MMNTARNRLLAAAICIVVLTVFSSPVASAEAPAAGDPAPAFSTRMVIGDRTVPVSLADYRGKKVILYFYPKDFTSGCTTEACAFRDGFASYKKAGIVVLGCSVDSEQSHREFIKRHNLPFGLLLDPDKKIALAYDAADGIPLLGLDGRITYLIGEDGKILKVYPRVDPATHASQILADLAYLKAEKATRPVAK